MEISAALVVCRLAHFIAAMALFGVTTFIAIVAPPGMREKLSGRFHRLNIFAVAVALVTAILWLLLAAGAAGEGWPDAIDPRFLADFLGTRFGEVWIVRIVLVLLLASLSLAGRRIDSRWVIAASGLFLATLALVGHSAGEGGLSGIAQRLNQALHLLCAAFWLGGLAPLYLVLRDVRVAGFQPDAATALRRYSGLGHFAVASVIATGIVNTRLVLRGWPLDPSSPYQVLLAAKIALVAAMALLALFNRYRLAPRLAVAPDAAAHALSTNIVIELALGGVVLALVSAFATFDPV